MSILKEILEKYQISGYGYFSEIKQKNGKKLTKTQGYQFLNKPYVLRNISAEEMARQTCDFLIKKGVNNQDITEIKALFKKLDDQKLTSDHPSSDNNYLDIPENDMLTHVAKKHFKLFRDPFIDSINGSADVFLNEDGIFIRESMFDAAKRGGFLAIVGESGSGKTTLFDDLSERIIRDGEDITIIQPRSIDRTKLTAAAICDAIIQDVSQEKPRAGLESKSRQITRLLTDSSRAGMRHVIVIDESHDLTITVLKYLKRFWEIKDGHQRLLGIVLIGQPELKNLLNVRLHWEAREVINRCNITDLKPLGDDIRGYLDHKFRRVSLGVEKVFEEEAFEAILNRLTISRGTHPIRMDYPLMVNNTAVAAMNIAAKMGFGKVNADIVKGV